MNCKVVKGEPKLDPAFDGEVCRLFRWNGFCGLIRDLDEAKWKELVKKPFEVPPKLESE